MTKMKEVLQRIKPSKEEEKNFKAVINSFVKKLTKNLKNQQIILGGSGAKDTWLSGNHDIDVFVAFTSKQSSKELSNQLEKFLKKSFPKQKISRVHGSRDYFRLKYQDIDFEVVPIIKISKSEDAMNITDISPLHSKWVNRHGKGKKDEIRLIKQFCKANKLYGAESHIKAFSGYVLEILIIHYGSFKKVLEASQKWKDKEIIDPSKFHKKKMALMDINKSKLHSPIIIVDPVDRNRNAAAALSGEVVKKFKNLARQYLKNPSESFFQKEELNLEIAKKKVGRNNLLFIELQPLKGKNDVVGAKLLKIFELLKRELQQFHIIKSDWDWSGGNAKMFFSLKKNKLSESTVRVGPPLKMKDAVKNFKKKNKKTFQEEGRVKVRIKTKFPKLKDFTENVLKDSYVKEKMKGIKELVVS